MSKFSGYLWSKINEAANYDKIVKSFDDVLKAAFDVLDKCEQEYVNGLNDKSRPREKNLKDKNARKNLPSICEDDGEPTKPPPEAPKRLSARSRGSRSSNDSGPEPRASKKRHKNEVDGILSPELDKRQKRSASVRAQTNISKQVNVNLTQKLRRENSKEKLDRNKSTCSVKLIEEKENLQPDTIPMAQIKQEKISLPSDPEPMEMEAFPTSTHIKLETRDDLAMPPPAAPLPRSRKGAAKEKPSAEASDESTGKRRTRTTKTVDPAAQAVPTRSTRSSRARQDSTRQTDSDETNETLPDSRPKRTRPKKKVSESKDGEKDTQSSQESVPASPTEKPRPKRTRRAQKAAEKEKAIDQEPPVSLDKENSTDAEANESPVLMNKNMNFTKTDAVVTLTQITQKELDRYQKVASADEILAKYKNGSLTKNVEKSLAKNKAEESLPKNKNVEENLAKHKNDEESSKNKNFEDSLAKNKNVDESLAKNKAEEVSAKNSKSESQKITAEEILAKFKNSGITNNKNVEETLAKNKKIEDSLPKNTAEDVLTTYKNAKNVEESAKNKNNVQTSKNKHVEEISTKTKDFQERKSQEVVDDVNKTHVICITSEMDKSVSHGAYHHHNANETVVIDTDRLQTAMDATVVIHPGAKVASITDDESLLTDDSDAPHTPPQTRVQTQPTSAVKEKVQQFEEMASRVTRTKTRAQAKKAEEECDTESPAERVTKAPLSVDTLTKMNSLIFNGKTPQVSNAVSKPRVTPLKPSSATKPTVQRTRDDEREDARKKKEAILEAKREQQRRKREEKMAAAAAARKEAERERQLAASAAARDKMDRQAALDLGRMDRAREMERKKQELARKVLETEERRRAEEAARQQRLADEQRKALALRKKHIEEQEAAKRYAALMDKEIERKQREYIEKQKKQRMDKASTPFKLPPSPARRVEPTHMEDGFQYLNSDEEQEDQPRPPPAWSTTKARRSRLLIQSEIQQLHIDKLFSVRVHSPDLREIFPAIERTRLKRTSSAVWRTPPQLPPA